MIDIEGYRNALEAFGWELRMVENALIKMGGNEPSPALIVNQGLKETTFSKQVDVHESGLRKPGKRSRKATLLGRKEDEAVRKTVQRRVAREGLREVRKIREQIQVLSEDLRALRLDGVVDHLPNAYRQAADNGLIREQFEQEVKKAMAKDLGLDERTIEYNTREMPKSAIVTESGREVRSKNEALILHMLDAMGVEYEYEECVELIDQKKRHVIRCPDANLRARSGARKYIEIWGMMDKEDYLKDRLDDIELYHRNGIILGEDLFVIGTKDRNSINCFTARKLLEAIIEM